MPRLRLLLPALLLLALAPHPPADSASPGLSTAYSLIENLGQDPAPVRFTAALGAAKAWLADDAVWLSYTDGAAVTHLRLDFGGPLDWQPLGTPGGEVCLVSAGPAGAETLRPPSWRGARAELPGGGSIVVSADGVAITGGDRASAALTIAGGSPAVGQVGQTPALRVGAHALPLRWEIPLTINGLPAGSRGGSAAASPGGGSQLLFGTYIGGENWDEGQALARDAAGNIYVAGQSLSLFFPTAPGSFTAPRHNVEAYVARMNWMGTSLDYICVIRADVEDWGTALAVDAAGNAFLFGRTDSILTFPFTPGAYDTTPNGGFDAFLVKFSPAGELVFSTLLGGGEDEFAGGVAVRPDGSVVMAGSTASDGATSAAFPTTAGAYKTEHSGGRDIFIAAMNAAGSALLYSTFIGGSGNDHIEAIALSGAAVVAGGWTASPDFDPPAGGFDTSLAGTFDGLLLSLTPGESSLDFWTYLGGLDDGLTGDRILALAVDGAGSVFAGGSTFAADFPATSGAFDDEYDASCSPFLCADGFVAKLSSTGSSLLWATFLGAEGEDAVQALALAPTGDLVLAGATSSAAFPASPDAFDGTLDGGSDAFVARLAGSGAALPYATYLGGSEGESAQAVAVTAGGWLLSAGWSDSLDFPTTPGAYDPAHNFDKDVFVAVLIPPGGAPLLEIFLPIINR